MYEARTSPGSRALSIVLVVLGLASAYVAVNVAFGGLETLGLQGPTHYYRVTDEAAHLVRDSHARFYGGVYLGLAIFLIVGSTDLRRYRTGLSAVFGMIFLGGIARLSQSAPDVTFGSDLALSTLVELVGMPILFWWLRRVTAPERFSVPTSAVPVEPVT